jgi:DNA-binding transcriptional LysR family regulator
MKIDINLFYLKCFYDAVLMGSVSESARRNFVSQPAVSQAIAKLEQSLGVLLCLHKKQQFKLTTEGELVFGKAKEIFSSVRQLQDALDRHRDHPKMPLRFVTTHSIGLSVLPHFIGEFKSRYPNMEIHFQFGGLTQIKGWLKQGIAEFALVLESPHLVEYQQMPLYTGQFGLYKHTKEKRKPKIAGVCVEHKEGMMVPEFQALYKASHREELPIYAELNSWELIARSMEHSRGYGLIPDLITIQRRYPCLSALPSEPTLPYTLSAIFPRGDALSYSAELFLQALKGDLNGS